MTSSRMRVHWHMRAPAAALPCQRCQLARPALLVLPGGCAVEVELAESGWFGGDAVGRVRVPLQDVMRWVLVLVLLLGHVGVRASSLCWALVTGGSQTHACCLPSAARVALQRATPWRAAAARGKSSWSWSGRRTSRKGGLGAGAKPACLIRQQPHTKPCSLFQDS